MIGLWSIYSTQYLYILATGTIIFFGLPMLISPIRWAKVLRWTIPNHTDLAVYFGRCLGAVICVMAYFAIRANQSTITQKYYFDLILCNFVMMVLVHLYGWIKKIQPLTETLEILYWGGLIVVTLLFYPA